MPERRGRCRRPRGGGALTVLRLARGPVGLIPAVPAGSTRCAISNARERLVEVGERLQRDAILLLDREAFDGEEIASACVEADMHFADAADRRADASLLVS